MPTRWEVLEPSGVVGQSISREDAGVCTVCRNPWADGAVWIALSQYDENEKFVGSGSAHEWCVGRLTHKSTSVAKASSEVPPLALPLTTFRGPLGESLLSTRWDVAQGSTVVYDHVELFRFDQDAAHIHGKLVHASISLGGVPEGRKTIMFRLAQEQHESRAPGAPPSSLGEVSLVWLDDRYFAEIERVLEQAGQRPLAAVLREGRIKLEREE